MGMCITVNKVSAYHTQKVRLLKNCFFNITAVLCDLFNLVDYLFRIFIPVNCINLSP